MKKFIVLAITSVALCACTDQRAWVDRQFFQDQPQPPQNNANSGYPNYYSAASAPAKPIDANEYGQPQNGNAPQIVPDQAATGGYSVNTNTPTTDLQYGNKGTDVTIPKKTVVTTTGATIEVPPQPYQPPKFQGTTPMLEGAGNTPAPVQYQPAPAQLGQQQPLPPLQQYSQPQAYQQPYQAQPYQQQQSYQPQYQQQPQQGYAPQPASQPQANVNGYPYPQIQPQGVPAQQPASTQQPQQNLYQQLYYGQQYAPQAYTGQYQYPPAQR